MSGVTAEDLLALVNGLSFAQKVERSLDLIADARRAHGRRIVVANSLGKDSVAVWVSVRYLQVGITVMVIAIGLFIVVAQRFKVTFRMRNVAVLAAIAAFNKAFSGGGYGPLVAGGQVLVGMPVKAAVATTAIAEAMVCTAAVAAYFAAGQVIALYLIVPLLAGALLSTPLSAITLRRLPAGLVKRVMGLAIVALGVWALAQGKGV